MNIPASAPSKQAFLSHVFPDPGAHVSQHSYICPASVRGPVALPANFIALHFVQLPVSLNNEFTWAVQRGPQVRYGYLLQTPLTDYRQAAELTQRLAARYGIEVDSPLRFAWAPYGRADVVAWAPGNRWTVDDLLADAPALSPGVERRAQYLLNGRVDDVLEWLIESGRFLAEAGKHWRIRCPWEAEHFEVHEGGYWPGRQRRFRCLDPACEGRSVQDFLAEVYHLGGPPAAVQDTLGPLLAEWALTPRAWLNVRTRRLLPLAEFRRLFSADIRLPDIFGRFKPMPLWRAAQRHPALLRLIGDRFEPGAPLIVGQEFNTAALAAVPGGEDEPARITAAILDFCSSRFEGAVYPPHVCAVMEALGGERWARRARAILQRDTDTLTRIYQPRAMYLRQVRSAAGYALRLEVQKFGPTRAKDAYPLDAENAILCYAKQLVK